MGYVPRIGTDQVYNLPRKDKHAAVNKADRIWRVEVQFDIRHGDAEFSFSF